MKCSVNRSIIQRLTFNYLITEMHSNQSTSTFSYHHAQHLSSCGDTILAWSIIHLCYTWFVTLHFLLPLGMTLSFGWEILRRSSREIDRYDLDWNVPSHESGDGPFARLRRYIADEVRLVLIYISLAFVFTLCMGHGSINRIKIIHWGIEASWTPHALSGVIGVYSNQSYTCLLGFENPLFKRMIYMTKGCLFIWMRYTEWYPSSKLNDYLTFFFYMCCNEFDLYRRPDDHLLARAICRIKIA